MIKEIFSNNEYDSPILLDGPMGSELIHLTGNQQINSFLLNHENPELITKVHQTYLAAGSEILFTNSFGCLFDENQKLNPKIYRDCLQKSIRHAKAVAKDEATVGFSVGPSGLSHHTTLTNKQSFEKKLESLFDLALPEDIDFIVFETQYHFEEIKTLLEIARPFCPLPLWLSLTVNESGDPLFHQSHPDWLKEIEDLGVDVLGFNCGTGPESIIKATKKFGTQTELPLFVKPSKGLPDKQNNYQLSDEDFVRQLKELKPNHLYAIGTCCGGTSHTIAQLKKMIENLINNP